MSTTTRELYHGIRKLMRIVYIRSDVIDYLYKLCYENDRLKYLISNTVMANRKLKRRIKEANIQNNAAIVWASFSPRGTGKSWFNYQLAKNILETRNSNIDWKKRIVFKSDGEIINTPSKWGDGIKYIAENMSNPDDGSYWALLQDELDKEWGEDKIRRRESQKDAISNLRKLGLCCGFASPAGDENMNYDMEFFILGYSKKTRRVAAIMKFRRYQGVITMRLEDEVFDFLEKQYNIDAKMSVWDKAKNGFYQQTRKIDKEEEESDDDNNNFSYSYDGNRFRLLRDLFKSFWTKTHDVNEPYARYLTSYYLWGSQFRVSNSKKKIYPSQITIENLPQSQAAKDWVDEIAPNSLNQAKYQYSSVYEGYEDKVHTKELEKIGEKYLSIVISDILENLTEHLIPPLPSVSVRTQYRSTYSKKGGKPYDLVVLCDDVDVVAFNHKLMTSGKNISKSQYNKYFGISLHPVSVLWMTYTRPFREYIYVRLSDEFLSGSVAGSGKLINSELFEKSGLGVQWKEVDDTEFEEILEIVVSNACK